MGRLRAIGIHIRRWLELFNLARKLVPSDNHPSMSKLSEKYLGHRVDKVTRLEDWELKNIPHEQLIYAATDAEVGLLLGNTMLKCYNCNDDIANAPSNLQVGMDVQYWHGNTHVAGGRLTFVGDAIGLTVTWGNRRLGKGKAKIKLMQIIRNRKPPFFFKSDNNPSSNWSRRDTLESLWRQNPDEEFAVSTCSLRVPTQPIYSNTISWRSSISNNPSTDASSVQRSSTISNDNGLSVNAACRRMALQELPTKKMAPIAENGSGKISFDAQDSSVHSDWLNSSGNAWSKGGSDDECVVPACNEGARLDYNIDLGGDESLQRGQYFYDLTDKVDGEDELDK